MFSGNLESAAVLSSFTSVFSGADERMAGRMIPHCDIREVRSARRKVKPVTERMKLPEKIFFNSENVDHAVMAWCLSLRNDLNEFEKNFLALALKATNLESPLFSKVTYDTFLILNGYKERFEDGSMSRGERYRVLDTYKEREQYKAGVLRDLCQVLITRKNANNLKVMVELALVNIQAAA